MKEYLDRWELNTVDYSGRPWRWGIRRILIGIWIAILYIYGIGVPLIMSLTETETYSIHVREAQVQSPGTKQPEKDTKQTLSAPQEPPTGDSKPDWKELLLVGKNPLLMITFGFLGSVFFVTRTFLRAEQNRDLRGSWYVLRPLQGALMALFIYYSFRAGQLVFYSGEGTRVAESAINVYTLSVLAVFAGMFSDYAYERLRAAAIKVFGQLGKDTDAT